VLVVAGAAFGNKSTDGSRLNDAGRINPITMAAAKDLDDTRHCPATNVRAAFT
jgi:hypothetical protein